MIALARQRLPLIVFALSLAILPKVSALDYERDIMPIFEAKCFDCHSAEADKIKGGLRLDDPQHFFDRFAKNDVVIPGDWDASYLFVTITRPHDAEEAMPPKDKGTPLTPEEVMLVATWIHEGANIERQQGEAGPDDYRPQDFIRFKDGVMLTEGATAAPEPSPATAAAEPTMQTWTNIEGRTITAAFKGIEAGAAILVMANGQTFHYPLKQLSVESQAEIRRLSGGGTEAREADMIQENPDWIDSNASKPASAGAVEDLSALISGVPVATGTPAIGVLLVIDGETRGIGVAGFRKAGGPQSVEPDDKWHLGSCTKSMTATLAGALVEEGKITWETTVSEVLGKEIKMLEAYESVTLGMLLAHRSGIPGSPPKSIFDGIEIGAKVTDLKDRDLIKQRARYVEAVLNIAPSSPPNSAYEYSNAGYTVAGAMLEQLTGKPWERLMEERIFQPLGMTKSGFGNAARDDKSNPTQPWPHENGSTPVDPGNGDDNPWVIGPAGTVHCSLKDVARYVSMHASRELGPVLKKEETFTFLHTALPQNENYARGWIVTATAWSQGPAIAHDGSNTMNHCSIWIAPERKAAVAAFTNSDEKGSESCRMAIERVVEKYFQ